MNVSRSRPSGPRRLLAVVVVVALLTTETAVCAQPVQDAASVFATTYHGYTRPLAADGSPIVQTYAFAQGDREPGGLADASLDRMPFVEVARVLAAPLRARSYEPSFDPKTCDLMIMVHWGRTAGARDSGTMGAVAGSPFDASAPLPGSGVIMGSPEGAAAESSAEAFYALNRMENLLRDRANQANARVLGYGAELARVDDISRFAGRGPYNDDIVGDVEEDRYWVVLTACDFQTLAREKKKKVLWITRFSLRARGHDFDQSLRGMAEYASRYFGRSSNGLRRGTARVGTVNVGEATPVPEPRTKAP